MVITIVSFFIMLIVLVLIHEIGHFVAARATKVKVEEFGLFYPPRIWGFKRGETLYSINAIPIGGFVKLAGEEDPKIKDSLASKSKKVRILVLAAGSIMNLILPLILLSVAFMVPHNEVTAPSIVSVVVTDTPAANAGILPGDTILKINDKPVTSPNYLNRIVQLNLGNNVTLVLQHADETISEVQLIPRWRHPENQGALGIEWDITAIEEKMVITRVSYPFWKAIPMGFTESIEIFGLFKNGIIGMMIGTTPVSISGPVGVAQMTGEAAKAGISALLEFTAFFSMNLGIINLLPLPALDGGRIIFVIIEWLRRGKRVSVKTEALTHTIGFILLIGLILLVTYNDIINIVRGG
jgi:regulator of sigma E protease